MARQKKHSSRVVASAPGLSIEPIEELLSIQDVMRILGVSRRTIHNLMSREGLPVLRTGRLVRFQPCSLRQWMREREHVA